MFLLNFLPLTEISLLETVGRKHGRSTRKIFSVMESQVLSYRRILLFFYKKNSDETGMDWQTLVMNVT